MIKTACYFKSLLMETKKDKTLEQFIKYTNSKVKYKFVHELDENEISFLTTLYNLDDAEYENLLKLINKSRIEYMSVKNNNEILKEIVEDDKDKYEFRLNGFSEIYRQRNAVVTNMTDGYIHEYKITSIEDLKELIENIKNDKCDLVEICQTIFKKKFDDSISDKYLKEYYDKCFGYIKYDITKRLNARLTFMCKNNDKNKVHNEYRYQNGKTTRFR